MSTVLRATTLYALIVTITLTMLQVQVVGAEQGQISIEGRVEWIAGNALIIALPGMIISSAGTSAVSVDLSHVDQDQYQGLTTGDVVLVNGTVTPDGRQIIAVSVRRLSS